MNSFAVRLDRNGATPLYYQIAAHIRWQIAVGELAPGSRLPDVRTAASLFKVNFHTVRQAYAELSYHGLIATRQGSGTTILPAASQAGSRSPEKFVRSLLQKAQTEYGLNPEDLASLIVALPKQETQQITMVECSDSQSEDLAGQLRIFWKVPVTPWNFHNKGLPPSGPLIATYFHFTELRKRWPMRIGDVHFCAVKIDPELSSTLLKKYNSNRLVKFVIVEKEKHVAEAVAADIQKILPASVKNIRLEQEITKHPERILKKAERDSVLLFPPRCWDELSAKSRKNPRAISVRYVFQAQELATIASDLRL